VRLIDRIAGQVGPPDVLVNTIGAFRPETRSPAAIGLGLVIAPSISTALYEGRTYQPCLYQSSSAALGGTTVVRAKM